MEELRLSRIAAACLEYAAFVASLAVILALAGAPIVRAMPDMEWHWHAAAVTTIVLAAIFRTIPLFRALLPDSGPAD